MKKLIIAAVVLAFYSYSIFAEDCLTLSGNAYWLCKAIQERNCLLANGNDYWICKEIIGEK